MSDLISRSEAIQRLIQETIDSKNNLIHINTVKRLLQDVDTAYDVDKVIDKLENLADDANDHMYESYFDGKEDGIRKAIEIVKQGGASDDVCECRLLKGYNFLHKTSCGDVFDMENGFKYCPYCGKKIKIVGD